MQTAKSRVLAHLLRYSLGTKQMLLVGTGCGIKALEAALAKLIAAGLVVAYPFIGTKKFYMLSAKGARQQGLDPKRFMRRPGPEALSARLTISLFCQQFDRRLLTRSEFAAVFPAQAR